MKTTTIRIVDKGRGPQLSTTRVTVLDIFYYLRRGHEFDFIAKAIPTLSRAEFDVAAKYIDENYDALLVKDRETDEIVRKGVEAQRARGGIFADSHASLSTEKRLERLHEILNRRHSERQGERHSG